MNKSVWLFISCLAGAYAVACSSSSGTTGTQSTSSGGGGHTTTTSNASSSGTTTTSTATGTGGTTTTTTSSSTTTTTTGCTAPQVALTVKNYLGWCNVTVNGGTASTAATQTVCVTPGAIPVAAVANAGFTLGAKPWHDTTGDVASAGDPGVVTGSGQTASDATTVTVVTAKCAWVCCETSGTTDCPTTDQCP